MLDPICLYNLTIRRPTHTTKVVVGQFTPNEKIQELVFANSTNFEMYRPHQSSNKLYKICQQDTWSKVKDLGIYRLAGSSEDLLVVTSECGKLSFLKFDVVHKQFYPVLSELHSSFGVNRTTPGEYLAIDPQNRAIMISAIETNKLVYKVSSSYQSPLIRVGVPLEANSREHVTFDLIALDTGFENPIFASIESSYDENNNSDKDVDVELLLVYYEFDQELNHIVTRKSKVPIPGTPSKLIAIPNSVGGGVVICSESILIYEAIDGRRKYIQIPRRDGESPVAQILSFTVHKMEKEKFFILLQSNLGDLFKLTFQYNEEDESMESINLTYFDTIPVCHSISILKAGFLLANVADLNKLYYQLKNLGDDVDDSTSRETDELSDMIPHFEVRKDENLANLSFVHSIETLNPIIDMTAFDSTKQIVTLSSNSYLKTLSYGMPTSTFLTSPLPMKPTTIFRSKLKSNSKNDEYLVLTSTISSTTLVLSIGKGVEEVIDSQFISNQPTIAVQQIGKSSIIQIYPNGIRHVNTKTKETTDWYPPAGISIILAGSNNEQVIVALLNRELCYFEVDPTDDRLIEYHDRLEIPGGIITSIVIPTNDLPDSVKGSLAVVGCARNKILGPTLTVVSLRPNNCLEIIALVDTFLDIKCMIILNGNELHIGTAGGSYSRSYIDYRTGNCTRQSASYFGNKPVDLSTIKLLDPSNGSGDEELITGVLAVSAKSWIGYNYRNKFKLMQLLHVNIVSAASFFSEEFGGDAIAAINEENELVIFTLGDGKSDISLDEDFYLSSLKLRYTPIQMTRVTYGWRNERVCVIGSQFGVESKIPVTKLEEGKSVESETEDEDVDPTPVSGYWSSCLQVVDVLEQKFLDSVEFSTNERALSIAQVDFTSLDKCVVIGTSSEGKYYLYVFKITERLLQFLHKTEVDRPPNALLGHPLGEKVLVAMPKNLRFYELGERQLLRTSSTIIGQMKNIVSLRRLGSGNSLEYFMVEDIDSSVSLVGFDRSKNEFLYVGNDILNRQITAMWTGERDSRNILGGDKLGNLFVSRVTPSLENKYWSKINHQTSYLSGSASEFHSICEYHIGDTATSFTNPWFLEGGDHRTIMYTGLQGTLGLLFPIWKQGNMINFFHKLQRELRVFFNNNFDELNIEEGYSNILSRDHKKFRSYYTPCRNVIDGDLLEIFLGLPEAIKEKISKRLDESPDRVEREIKNLRNCCGFRQ